jgi:protoporphyrinogen oxidase
MNSREIIVIGGGLGGLCSAALLARAGHRVRLLEQAEHVGGRARSRTEHGFVHNLGAHALYCGGTASQVLGRLDVQPKGRRVGSRGAYLMRGERLSPMPGHAWSLLTSDVLGARGKWRFARLMMSLGERKADALAGISVRQWLDAQVPEPDARGLVEMLVRLTTYANAPELQSAAVAMRQLLGGVRDGVMYVEAGAQIELGQGIARIEHDGRAVQAVVTRDGRRLAAQAVIAAVEPYALSALLPDEAEASRWAAAAVPARAACLELGVGELPHPERLNVQAIDAPLYFSNHSAYAALAPAGKHVLHLVRYLRPEEDGRSVEPELRAFLERIQPRVYERAEIKRFVPHLIVHNAVQASARAPGAHPAIAGLHLVGDWVDSGVCLLDGVLASARDAVARIGSVASAGSNMARAQQTRDAVRAA